MIDEDRKRIIHGQVLYNNRWMSIEKKIELESKDKKKIEEGFVCFQGEWITIEEKIARTKPQASPQQKEQSIVFNQTINRQTYNVNHNEQIDNRVIHEHDHRHLHLDEQSIARYNERNFHDALSHHRTTELDQREAKILAELDQRERKELPHKSRDTKTIEFKKKKKS